MKKLFIFIIFILFTGCSFAEVATKKFGNAPEGTFRKKRNGVYVQYDKNGKKIGEYKISGRKYIKIK